MANVNFKYGVWSKFKTLLNAGTADTNTLYFITDRGAIYKGSLLLNGKISNLVVSSESDTTQKLTFTLTNDNSSGVQETIEVVTQHPNVTRKIAEFYNANNNLLATGKLNGFVKLSDATNSTSSEGNGVAATPKAVKDALEAAQDYASGLIGGVGGAMVFKGTLGTGGTVTALPTSGYKAGWTYRVVTAGTYAGQKCEIGDLIIAVKDYVQATASASADWTVAQNNIDGAVTASENLTVDAVIVGDGDTCVKKLANGTANQVLTIGVDGNPAWKDNVDEKVLLNEDTTSTSGYLVFATGDTNNGDKKGVKFNKAIKINSSTKELECNVKGSLNGNSSTATSIKSGTLGQIPYQTGVGTTGFISAPTQNHQLLRSVMDERTISFEHYSPGTLTVTIGGVRKSYNTMQSIDIDIDSAISSIASWEEL